jgi:transcriptional regulator (fragment)
LTKTNNKNTYKKVTLKDVAQKAGVSYASVSAVLNNASENSIRVGENTKHKILAAADILGYVPDVTARSLKSGKKSLIAVFTYEKNFPVKSDNEFYAFFAGVQEQAEQLGYDLLIINRRNTVDDTFSRVLFADGAIVIGVHKDTESIKTLVKHRFPIVFIGRREFEGIKTNWITFNYRPVIYELIGHLCSIGAESILYIEDTDSISEAAEDKKHFLYAAAAESRLNISVYALPRNVYTRESIASIQNARIVILSRISQIASFEALCNKLHIEIGHDLLAAVLEDDWTGLFSHWTRWSNRRMELGAGAVDLLIKLCTNAASELQDTAIKPELIKGKTTLGYAVAAQSL